MAWILGQMEEMLWTSVLTVEGDLQVHKLVVQRSDFPSEMHRSQHGV